MPSYTQLNRRISIETSLGEDVLLLRSFQGREAISRMFQFDLELLSESDSISFDDIVGQRVTLSVLLADGTTSRYWNGFISRFVQAGRDQNLTRYQAVMVPWLWFLTRTTDCRIFQQKKVPDIIQQIFNDAGLTDYSLRLYGDFVQRDYCVQYRETDFNFVSRLMEEEGIFYFFEHQEDKHVMVLANDPSAHKPCPNQPEARYELSAGGWQDDDVVLEWYQEQELRPGVYTSTDYNFETPTSSLASSVTGKTSFEIYDYPGEYRKRGDGDGLVRIRLQEQEMARVIARGTSDCRDFATGFRFDLKDHYRTDLNQTYVLTAIGHTATQGSGYTSGGGGDQEVSYRNTFECIPYPTPFRPQRITPTPVVQGCQTAVVVGPSGEEIYTDKYGRVKVQFHWDREGKNNENSSCWIRVSHPWAGKGWGSIAIPRIGQEVIVDFMEGDPDQPIITGRVYNAGQMPPFGMPAGAVVSGIMSNSTKGGGGYNEISLNDTKGKELINIHAQYDMTTTVEHDDTQTVHNNRAIKVDGTHNETITKDTNITIEKGPYFLDVQNNTYTHHVKGKVLEVYDDEQDTVVEKNIITVSKSAQIIIDAKTEITLLCGQSILNMKQNGTIILSGVDITISGTQKVTIGCVDSGQTAVYDTSQVTVSGAGITSTAVGVHNIKGSLVKIN